MTPQAHGDSAEMLLLELGGENPEGMQGLSERVEDSSYFHSTQLILCVFSWTCYLSLHPKGTDLRQGLETSAMFLGVIRSK